MSISIDAAKPGPHDDPVQSVFLTAYADGRTDLLSWLTALVHDGEAAEDYCEEAYARLYRELRAGRTVLRPGAWLHRVARNLVISDARHARVAASVVAGLAPIFRERDPTATAAITSAEWQGMDAVMGTLDPGARQVLLLAGIGCDTRSIARRLHTTEGAARTRLHRARVALRQATDVRPGP